MPSFPSPRKPRLTSPPEENVLSSTIIMQERRNAVARIYVPGSVRAKVILQKPVQLKGIPPSVRQQQCREMRRQTQLRKILNTKRAVKEEAHSEVSVEDAEVKYQLLAIAAAQRTARHVARVWVTRAKDRAVRHIVRDRRAREAKYAEETCAVRKIQWAYRCHRWRIRSVILLRIFTIVQAAKEHAAVEEEQAFFRRISQRRTEEERVADELQQLYFSASAEDSVEVPPLTVQEFYSATLEPFCQSLISRIRKDIERNPVDG